MLVSNNLVFCVLAKHPEIVAPFWVQSEMARHSSRLRVTQSGRSPVSHPLHPIPDAVTHNPPWFFFAERAQSPYHVMNTWVSPLVTLRRWDGWACRSLSLK